MNEKVSVIRLVSKVEEVEVKTSDSRYRLSGRLVGDEKGALAFDGGAVVCQDDGVEVARVESWSRNDGLSIRIKAGRDLMEVSTVIKELIDTFAKTDNLATEEGGAA